MAKSPEEKLRYERNRRRHMWFNHAVEQLRYAFFRPRRHHRFFVVTAAYKAEQKIQRTLRSVARQRYPAELVEHLVIDDASPDGTTAAIESWIADAAPAHRITLQTNPDNVGGCANYTKGFRAAPRDAIVLQLDGDDWLPDLDVLGYLNMAYHDPDLWMTYNSWRDPRGVPAIHHHEMTDVIRDGRLRTVPWRSSHLHSFRARLFEHVRDESLQDPETGTFWRYAVDQSHYLPMLEMARHHARHLDRFTYVYDLNEGSVLTLVRDEQLDCERRIRALPAYAPLDRL